MICKSCFSCNAITKEWIFGGVPFSWLSVSRVFGRLWEIDGMEVQFPMSLLLLQKGSQPLSLCLALCLTGWQHGSHAALRWTPQNKTIFSKVTAIFGWAIASVLIGLHHSHQQHSETFSQHCRDAAGRLHVTIWYKEKLCSCNQIELRWNTVQYTVLYC